MLSRPFIQILTASLGLIIGLGCRREGPADQGPAAAQAKLAIRLPDKSALAPHQASLLTGYRILLEPRNDPCPGVRRLDVIRSWDAGTEPQLFTAGCAYRVDVEVGKLDSAAQELSEIYYSSIAAPEQRIGRTATAAQEEPRVLLLRLLMTEMGRSAGFISAATQSVKPEGSGGDVAASVRLDVLLEQPAEDAGDERPLPVDGDEGSSAAGKGP